MESSRARLVHITKGQPGISREQLRTPGCEQRVVGREEVLGNIPEETSELLAEELDWR